MRKVGWFFESRLVFCLLNALDVDNDNKYLISIYDLNATDRCYEDKWNDAKDLSLKQNKPSDDRMK